MQSSVERRIEILRYLNVKRRDTYDNLAFRFGVSKMTIRRDIEYLILYHPIGTVRGNGGGVFVLDGYSAFDTGWTEEQEFLFKKVAVGLDEKDSIVLQSIVSTRPFIRKKFEGVQKNGFN